MKKIAIVSSLISLLVLTPKSDAQLNQLQCTPKYYCGYNYYNVYTCWWRPYCCEWTTNPYNGIYTWQCFWN